MSLLHVISATALLGVLSATAAPQADSAPGPTPMPRPAPSTFDGAAALAALGVVDLQACKKPNEFAGEGSATVMFDNAGNVASIVLGKGYGGTPVGGCIIARLRPVKVKAYKGPVASVDFAFTLTPRIHRVP
jgi:hypothetical protein